MEGFLQDTCALLEVISSCAPFEIAMSVRLWSSGKHLITGRFSDATQAGRSTSDTTLPNSQEKHVLSTLESG